MVFIGPIVSITAQRKTESSFKRGELAKNVDSIVYDDIRFTGWSTVPYFTQLKYDWLDGLQEKKFMLFITKSSRKSRRAVLGKRVRLD